MPGPGALSFGELLRQHRLAIGLSQETLAERSRISTSAVGALERGDRRAPYRDTVELLANALELKGDDRTEFGSAAERARGRQRRIDAVPPPRNNLPLRLTSLIGRDVEIGEIRSLLERGRFITITGSGGVGKTRVALEIAQRAHDESYGDVCFVDLSQIVDGARVPVEIADALDVAVSEAADPVAVLASRLKSRTLMLFLDNCEHVIDDVARVAAAILRVSTNITILATSRERLAIEGEQVYRLPSLAIPMKNPVSIQEAQACASMRLFIERITALDPHLTFSNDQLRMSAEICRTLEGIPLAIEMAASLAPTLGFTVLSERLKERVVLAGGSRDLPQRQRTMDATIAWSYDLLSNDERLLLQRLAIFRGGFSLAAAEAVCPDASLTADAVSQLVPGLVDKSLLTAALSGEQPRYSMLESVRAFASNRLTAAGERTRTARAHLAWMATFAQRGWDRFFKDSPADWFREFACEMDNVRSALEWARDSDTYDDILVAARIIGGLRGLWIRMDRLVECRYWTSFFIGRIDALTYPEIIGPIMAADIQVRRGLDACAAAERAFPVFERLGDRMTLMSLNAHVAHLRGERNEFEEADRALERAFALADPERPDYGRRMADVLDIRAGIRIRASRYAEARADFAEALRLRGPAQSENLQYLAKLSAASLEFCTENVQRSLELFEEVLQERRKSSVGVSYPLIQIAAIRLKLGDVEGAESAAREAIETANFEPHLVADAIWQWSAIVAVRGNPRAACRLFGFARTLGDGLNEFGPISKSSHAILKDAVAGKLDAAEIMALEAEGAALDLDTAVLEALDVRWP